jgi:hypothetical protein
LHAAAQVAPTSPLAVWVRQQTSPFRQEAALVQASVAPLHEPFVTQARDCSAQHSRVAVQAATPQRTLGVVGVVLVPPSLVTVPGLVTALASVEPAAEADPELEPLVPELGPLALALAPPSPVSSAIAPPQAPQNAKRMGMEKLVRRIIDSQYHCGEKQVT